MRRSKVASSARYLICIHHDTGITGMILYILDATWLSLHFPFLRCREFHFHLFNHLSNSSSFNPFVRESFAFRCLITLIWSHRNQLVSTLASQFTDPKYQQCSLYSPQRLLPFSSVSHPAKLSSLRPFQPAPSNVGPYNQLKLTVFRQRSRSRIKAPISRVFVLRWYNCQWPPPSFVRPVRQQIWQYCKTGMLGYVISNLQLCRLLQPR